MRDSSIHTVPILVVDDNQDSADALAQLLSVSGFDARSAGSGEEALRLAGEVAPACVLLDVRMPGMDGVELARRLREQFGGEVTLIAMTGVDQSSSQHRMIMPLVDHFLAKPIDVARLMRILAPLGH